MRIETLFCGVVLASTLPVIAEAQHSHGGAVGMDQMPRRERRKEPAPTLPRGFLPVGSARQVEVLVLDFGFSPNEIRADVGETITLLVRRANSVCVNGLSIPKRQQNLNLPPDETVPVTLELKQAERIELKCTDEDAAAVIIVGSP
jgi:plastocyanin